MVARLCDEARIASRIRHANVVPTLDVEKLRSKPVAAGLDSVRKTSDITKDQLFMRTQVELHREALAELQVLDGVAKNRELRDHISAMIPVVRDHLARVLGSPGQPPAVLVIDQFEEVFTLCDDDRERQAFVANLLELAR